MDAKDARDALEQIAQTRVNVAAYGAHLASLVTDTGY